MRLPTPLRLISGGLMSEPGAARHNDPFTSQLAAGSISATELERIVYAYLFRTGKELTAFEIARGLGMDIRSISPRLRPLELKNGVVRVGKKYCVNDAGNPTLMTTWLALP
jgi:DNA-binding CsgD family transcriptional regulator